jgi:hypothetical protein
MNYNSFRQREVHSAVNILMSLREAQDLEGAESLAVSALQAV